MMSESGAHRARHTLRGTRLHAVYMRPYDRHALCGIYCSGPLSSDPFDPEDPGACKSCCAVIARREGGGDG